MPRAAALLLLLLGLGVAYAAPPSRYAVPPTRPPRRESPAPTVGALPLPAPESRFALGINEAVAIPWRLAATMPIARQEPELARRAAASAGLGALFVRGHTGNYPWTSAQSLAEDPARQAQGDAWVRAVQAAGLEPTWMLSPWPGNDTGAHTASYPPPDMAAYTAYVRAFVERYDGDGIDDMPGLRGPVRYWEVDNEPDLKNSRPARSADRAYDPATFCTPQEYARVFLASAAAIKQAFPGARVLNGGLYKPHTAEGAAYFRAFASVPGVVDAIDVLSVHAYHDDADGSRLVAAIRNERVMAPTKPVWVTETSFGTDDGVTPEEQARMLTVLVARAALEGADKLFWHSLEDKPASSYPKKLPIMFGYSLLDNDGTGATTPKPVGRVYAALAGFLQAHDLNGCVEAGPGAVQLRDGSVLVYAGTRTVTGAGIDLRTGAALAAGSPAVAPAVLLPAASPAPAASPDPPAEPLPLALPVSG